MGMAALTPPPLPRGLPPNVGRGGVLMLMDWLPCLRG